jgi:predicted TIM-barrel fold metal-dependent hydrolase
MLAAAGGVATAHAGGRIMPNAVADEPAKTGMHKFSKLRTITLEEHYTGPPFIASGAHAPGPPSGDPHFEATFAKLKDLGAGRLVLMDEAGIDVQILSHTPGIEQFEASEQVPLVRDTNDYLKEMVAGNPTRFAGFASLCTMAPGDAAKELERMMQAGFKGGIINGHSHGRYLNDKFFWPMLEAAEHLDAPIYLHPTQPPKAVLDTYYSDFSPMINNAFSDAGCGWHMETGIHLTKMILGGVFDQFPNLKIVIGHMGEGLTFWLPRMDNIMHPEMTNLKQPISAYLRQNVYYNFSAFNFLPNFNILVSQVGIEGRIMFATDHPFGSMMEARLFLDSLPISPADRELIAHGNAERLFKM